MTIRQPTPAPRRLSLRTARTARTAVGALLVATLALASCGGSSEIERKFSPKRVIAFGDETSLIVDRSNNANGSKYTVNAITSSASPTLDCTSNPLWIQSLAKHFNLAFPQCSPGALQQPNSRIHAAYGARAGDLSQQIGDQIASDSFSDSDLVTVLVGVWDVVREYEKYPAVGEDELGNTLAAAGAETARQVNRLADLDARIIVSTMPDLSYSPWARNEAATHTDTDRAALIRRLVTRYNTALRSNIRNDGTHIGLVLTDELTQAVAKVPGTSGIVDSTNAVCDLSKSSLNPPSVLDCTPLTLISRANGSPSVFLWADDLHLTPAAQAQMGSLAITRATNNPF